MRSLGEFSVIASHKSLNILLRLLHWLVLSKYICSIAFRSSGFTSSTPPLSLMSLSSISFIWYGINDLEQLPDRNISIVDLVSSHMSKEHTSVLSLASLARICSRVKFDCRALISATTENIELPKINKWYSCSSI